MLSVTELHVFRGEQHVLRGLSFSAAPGQLVQVTGPNGSGKTTLLRSICGLVDLEAGSIAWAGLDHRRSRADFVRQLYYLGHDPGLKGDLSGIENLAFIAGLRRHVTAGEVGRALERTGAIRFADRPTRTLSAGQRRRIALAALWLSSAPLWVLDEPTTNLDANGQALVGDLIGEHLAAGRVAIAAVHGALVVTAGRVEPLRLGGVSAP